MYIGTRIPFKLEMAKIPRNDFNLLCPKSISQQRIATTNDDDYSFPGMMSGGVCGLVYESVVR